MHKRFSIIGSILAAAALALVAAPAPAAAAGKTTTLQSATDYMYFDAQTVATGAAYTSEVLDGRLFKSVIISAANSDGATRTLVAQCLSGSATTSTVVYQFPNVTVAASAKASIVIDPDITTTANVPSGTTVFNFPPCANLYVTSAAVSGAPTITVSGRGKR